MTDQPAIYTHPSGARVTIDSARGWGQPEHLHLSIVAPAANDRLSLLVPTARLLAMIDTEDPDGLRAYLRERSDYLDSPDETLSASIASFKGERITPDLLDAVPEADSPEDVDETPDPVDQLRESGRQLGEAWRAFTEGVRAGTFGTDR